MKLLRITLLSNAGFSLISGILLIVFRNQLPSVFGIRSSDPFLLVGIALLLFQAFVMLTAFGRPIRALLVKTIIIQDGLWVLGSLIIIGLQLFSLTTLGYALIASVAFVVTLFAWMQTYYLGKVNKQ